jgi:hypothetical protein
MDLLKKDEIKNNPAGVIEGLFFQYLSIVNHIGKNYSYSLILILIPLE